MVIYVRQQWLTPEGPFQKQAQNTLNNLSLALPTDFLAIGNCGKSRFDLEEYQKGVIDLQLLTINHGPISDHQAN
jgi:hypothetical protein